MSLIEEALKKAKKGEGGPSAPDPRSLLGGGGKKKGKGPLLLVILLFLVVIGAGAFFLPRFGLRPGQLGLLLKEASRGSPLSPSEPPPQTLPVLKKEKAQISVPYSEKEEPKEEKVSSSEPRREEGIERKGIKKEKEKEVPVVKKPKAAGEKGSKPLLASRPKKVSPPKRPKLTPPRAQKRAPSVEDLASLLQAAYLQMELGDLREALDLYNRVLERDPKNVEALTNRGIIFQRMGKLSLAERDLERALEVAPEDKAALNAMGVLCMRKGELLKASAYFERARDVAAMINMALLHWQRGELEKVIPLLKEAEGMDPYNPYPYYYEALFFQRKGEEERAKALLEISARLARERGEVGLLQRLEGKR